MSTRAGDTHDGAEAAEYIATVSTHLRDIAIKNDLNFLGYLLDMVVDEAWRDVSVDEADKAQVGTEGSPSSESKQSDPTEL